MKMTAAAKKIVEKFLAASSEEQSQIIFGIVPHYASTDPALAIKAFWAHQAGLPPEKRPKPPVLTPEQEAEDERRANDEDHWIDAEEMLKKVVRDHREKHQIAPSLSQ